LPEEEDDERLEAEMTQENGKFIIYNEFNLYLNNHY
jgi:hypothetical protein